MADDYDAIDIELDRREKSRVFAPKLTKTDLPEEKKAKKPKREDYEDERSYNKADRAYRRGVQEDALQK